MTQYIVFGRENHPDKFLTDIYGPFDTEVEADAYAEKCNSQSWNYNGKHRLFDHASHPLEAPSSGPSKLEKLAALFADDRRDYYGYEESSYERWQAYESIREEVLGILGN